MFLDQAILALFIIPLFSFILTIGYYFIFKN